MSDLIERLKDMLIFPDELIGNHAEEIEEAISVLSQDCPPKPVWPSAANPLELADMVEKIDQAITSPVENAKLFAAANMLRSLARDKATLLDANAGWKKENSEKRTEIEGLETDLRASTSYARASKAAFERIREHADFKNVPGGDMLPDLMGRLEVIYTEAEAAITDNGAERSPCQRGGGEPADSGPFDPVPPSPTLLAIEMGPLRSAEGAENAVFHRKEGE